MGSKKVLIIVGILLVGLISAGVWFFTLPTLDGTFAAAEKAETDARAKATRGAAPLDTAKDFAQVIELYKKVATFGKNEKHAESVYRIGKIQQDDIHENEAALQTYDDLIKNYPTDENRAGDAMIRSAKILREQGQIAAGGMKAEDVRKKYEDAITRLQGYRTTFPKGKLVDKSLLDEGNIRQQDMKSPPDICIRPFDELIKDHTKSEYRPEAKFHRAELLEAMGRKTDAKMEYAQLSEEYPQSEWARKGEIARLKILKEEADTAEKARQAAEEAKRLAEKNRKEGHEEEAGEAEGIEGEMNRSAAGQAASGSAKGRYGSIPVDTGYGAPAHEELKKFAEQKLDAKLYTMDVTFLPDENRITVKGTLQMTNAGDPKDRQLLFMLGGGFKPSKITLDGVDAPYEHPDDTLQIALTKPIKTGDTFLLGFEYTGRFAAPMVSNPADAKKLGDQQIDSPDDLKRLAEEAAKAAKSGGPEFNLQIALGKDGFALSGAGWYPITVIGDLFDANVTYHVPTGTQMAATGADLSTGKPGEFVYSTKRPVFGIYFSYGDYVVNEKTIAGVKYITYFKSANAPKSDAYIETVSRILAFYGDKFMPFPYEKMAIVETPLPPMLGGVGPSSMMMLNPMFVAQKDPPEWLLAHELAHQWFGNLIPINIADAGYSQWLSEGFATYCDAMYTEHRQGKERFLEQIRRYNSTYFQATGAHNGRTVGVNVRNCPQTTVLYRPIVYEKGALVLHSLRKVLGDDKFFALMKKYVDTYKDKNSTVGDFEKLAVEANGQPLDWFFKEWLDETGHAQWTIDDVAATTDADGKNYKLSLKVMQKKTQIRMPVDITVLGEGKDSKVFASIDIKEKEQSFDFDVNFKPTKVILDEDNWTLHSPSSSNTFPNEIDKRTIKISVTTQPATRAAETNPATTTTAPSTKPATTSAPATAPAATAPATSAPSTTKVETAPAPK